MMKKILCVIGPMAVLLLICGCFVNPPPLQKDINEPDIKPPVFRAKPTLETIAEVPGVSYVPGALNLFSYDNYWYYYCNENWFVANSYNGPWIYVETYALPGRLGQIPARFLMAIPVQQKSK